MTDLKPITVISKRVSTNIHIDNALIADRIAERKVHEFQWHIVNLEMLVRAGVATPAQQAEYSAWLDRRNDRLEQKSDMEKRFWVSIRPAKDCLFSRRNGLKGKIVAGYSVCVRLFGVNLL